MKNKTGKTNENQNIMIISYVLGLLFIGLIGYFSYFIQFKSEEVINNPYNARVDQFSQRVIRGKIFSNDKSVLAETVKLEDETEFRVYNHGPVFAHVLGYAAGNQGKTGLESLAGFYLLSSHINVIEQTVNEMTGIKNVGDNVITTLDLQLQNVAYDALGDRKGAVVVMEPDTGKVLAMVSKPNYDPNTLEQDWQALISGDNKQAQLLNRSTQGLYPPGSTFKVVTVLEYIKEHPNDYQDYVFDCNGRYQLGEYTIKCYHETAHGRQNLFQAFANSCNGAFASMGTQLDLSAFAATTNELLFNQELPIVLPYRKSSFTMTEGAELWEVLQTSIGQGSTQITPMHNALLAAAIANGGTLMNPYFIDRVENAGGEEVKKFMPTSYGNLITANEADILTEMMSEVVKTGTGSALRTAEYTVAGKTGSAEFETGKETHSLFLGFAPVENPKIVISVLVEEGGTGGAVAAPIARKVFDVYFSR